MDKLLRTIVWTAALVLIGFQTAMAPVLAQDTKLKKEELDQLLAPIALYPDDLLTNVLMASTYPLDVVQAARWRKEPANAKIKGDALVKALEPKDWDPSIKALVEFPDVLETMSDKLDWTQKLGDAFLAQQDEVMAEIQFLRQKAEAAGNLKSNKQQTVSTEAGAAGQEVIVIEPASPEMVYVPVYEPTVVYGSWWYPDYPPYYWSYPGASYVNGIFWPPASPSPDRSGAGTTSIGATMTSMSTSTGGTTSTSIARKSRQGNGSTMQTIAAPFPTRTKRCARSTGRLNALVRPAKTSGGSTTASKNGNWGRRCSKAAGQSRRPIQGSRGNGSQGEAKGLPASAGSRSQAVTRGFRCQARRGCPQGCLARASKPHGNERWSSFSRRPTRRWASRSPGGGAPRGGGRR